jgi:hypothetical protein
MRIGIVRLATALLIVSGVASSRLIGACLVPPPVCESAARADVVFFGEVLETTMYAQLGGGGPLPNGIESVTFKVIQPFKGVEGGEMSGLFYIDSESPLFKLGSRYLVFAHRRATGAFIHGCTLTREVQSAGDEERYRAAAAQLGACAK